MTESEIGEGEGGGASFRRTAVHIRTPSVCLFLPIPLLRQAARLKEE